MEGIRITFSTQRSCLCSKRCSAESNTAAVTDLNMSDLVPLMNADDAFETSYMKGLQSLDMATIRSPQLTTVQEDGDTDGFVDSYFCRHCKVTV